MAGAKAGDAAWERFLELVLHRAGFNTPVRVTIEPAGSRTRTVRIAGRHLAAIPGLAERLVAWVRAHQERVVSEAHPDRRVVISALEETPEGLTFILVGLFPDLIP